MKREIKITSCILIGLFAGCTLPSTKMAQEGSIQSQAVTDGVHRDMFTALERENYETTVLNIKLAAEKAKFGKTPEAQQAIDIAADQAVAAVKEFAKKRDFMTTWDRDHERSNAMKYVTVDSKLASEQGILNYLGSQLSDDAKKISDAWNTAKATTKAAK